MFEQNELSPKKENITSPKQELDFLHRKFEEKSNALETEGNSTDPKEIATSLIKAYQKTDPAEQHPNLQLNKDIIKSLALDLKPEKHDTEIGKLYNLIVTKGLRNTLQVVENIGHPHLTDDFHRFLVQFFVTKKELPGMKNLKEVKHSLALDLYQIELPPESGEQKSPHTQISFMEQFLAGMQTLSNDEHDTFAIEIAIPSDSEYMSFFVAVPRQKASVLEKLIIGLYHNAKINLIPDDYNIFRIDGSYICAHGTLENHYSLPVRTYDSYQNDPLNNIISAFSKLDQIGQGAALQFIIKPFNSNREKIITQISKELKDGAKFKDAIKKAESSGFTGMLSQATKEIFGTNEKKDSDKPSEIADELELTREKIKHKISPVNIRLITAAETIERAEEILEDITSAFHVYEKPTSNTFKFETIPNKKKLAFTRSFSFRTFIDKQATYLNSAELATVCHFPASLAHTPYLKQSQARTAPAPLEMVKEGILMGYNIHRGNRTAIKFGREDRMRHFYIVGQTGVGKSGTLLTMIDQDIQNGDGVCFIDPHGSDVHRILSFIPQHRYEDVIYFDPADTANPMGLNMLEYDPERPEQITLIIDELMGIFNQLFDMQATGGAQFQQYFKNSAFLAMNHPESGNTLLEITRILSNKEFRDMKLSHCTNPIVLEFWKNAESRKGEQSLDNFVPYITSKFDPLISNEILRPVIIQEKSAFNIKNVMDNKKILLVNLSKGRLGELNANLIGLILVGKIQMAALGRAGVHGKELADFFLYIDEFQNVTTPSVSSILSEARKYRLSMTMAHQFLSQLTDNIKNAVLGNVGSISAFRISPEDAKALEPRFEPTVTATDIIGLDNRNAYVSMLVKGSPTKPFSMTTADYPDGRPEIVDGLKELSALKYGRPRAEVEAEIKRRYQSIKA